MSRIRSASCSRDPDSRRSDITGRLCSRCSTARLSCERDRKSTRLNSSHGYISYAVFCLKKMITLTIRSGAADSFEQAPKRILQDDFASIIWRCLKETGPLFRISSGEQPDRYDLVAAKQ